MPIKIPGRFLVRVAVGAQLLLILAGSASAAVVLKLELPQLIQRSEHIAVAVALDQKARRRPDGRIVTDVTLRVEETLKGTFGTGQRIVVTSLGGTIGKLTMRVEGSPRFSTGRPAVVFLRETPGLGELQVVGMSQGVIHIDELEDRSLVVIPGGAGLTLLQRDADGELREAAQSSIEPGPLDELLTEIKRLVAEAHGK